MHPVLKLCSRILVDVFEAELRGQPLFRNGAGEAWHLSFTNLKAEYGLRKMVGVPALARIVAAVMVGPDLLSSRVLFPDFRDINKQPPSAESRQAPRSVFATWRSHVNVCGVLYLMRINDAHTAKIACVAPLYVVLPLGEHFLDHVLNPADS